MTRNRSKDVLLVDIIRKESNRYTLMILGKQIVYHTLQDDDPEMLDNNHIAAMDQEIEELRDTVTALKAKEKSLKLEVNALALTMTTVDLERDLSALHKEEQEISARLEKSRKGKENEKVVTPEEVENVTKEWEIWKRHVTIRKNICKELWERCSEILPPNVETREELWVSYTVFFS